MRNTHVNKHNYEHTDHPGLEGPFEQVTEPNDTLTLQELVRRYTKGETPEQRAPLYFGDTSVNIAMLDKFQRIELFKETEQHIIETRDRIAAEAAAENQAKAEEQIELKEKIEATSKSDQQEAKSKPAAPKK